MSSEALARPVITKNSSEFKLDAYASIPAGELVVFAVQLLQADAAPVAVEEVVSTCFRLFPHSFALKNYFYWPDSALVARRLHDAKEKGLLKGNPTDGYETKVHGRQVAKHVAKALGVSLPVRPKVEVTAPPVVEPPKVEEIVGKKEEEKKEVTPSAPAVKAEKKQETRNKKVQQKATKKTLAKKPALNKQAVKPKVKAKPKKEAAKVVPVKKKPASKPKIQTKKTAKPVAKAKAPVKQKQAKSAPKPKVEVKSAAKVKKIAEKKRETSKKEAKTSAQPKQLTMALPSVAAKKKAEVPVTKPKVKEDAAKPVGGEVFPPAAVSKEEKEKAAKVIKQLERSDAYQLYRRNGRRAQIGEFDFRNMLFATMESSAETLKRNVELFKRYAGIHFRTDLIAFLEFCEEKFSSLLISKAKVKGKK